MDTSMLGNRKAFVGYLPPLRADEGMDWAHLHRQRSPNLPLRRATAAGDGKVTLTTHPL
jgi:hypothetical protein